MIFSNTGNYIDEAVFNNQGLSDKNKDDESDAERKPNHAIKNQNLNLIDLKLKDARFEILDFKGEPYFPPEPPAVREVNELNKMELLQFSQSNQYFLFCNRMTEQLLVYELCQVKPVEQNSFFDLK